MAIIKSTKLYFKEGGSDKVYHAFIESAPGGFVVNFEFGRAGTKLQTGTKTTSPVDETQANAILEKLIKEKTAKGYKPE